MHSGACGYVGARWSNLNRWLTIIGPASAFIFGGNHRKAPRAFVMHVTNDGGTLVYNGRVSGMLSPRGRVMGGNGVARYSDPEHYQAAISPAHVEILVTAKGKYRAALTGIEVGRLWLQRGHESLARVANATVRADRAALFFLARADQPSTHHSGRALAFGEIAASAAGSTQYLRTDGPCHWATLSMMRDDLAAASHALVGRNLIERSVTSYFRPPVPLWSRLLNLHQAAGLLAENAADIIGQPEVARALERALLHAVIDCLSASKEVQADRTTLRRKIIIARLEEYLMANYDRPIYLADLCTAVGVSGRTLRLACMKQLGVGPNRFLWLRRIHLARRALIAADAAKETVTKIATEYGFWELGRFSVEYRKLFGEMPSASLHRPPQQMRSPKTGPFDLAVSENV